MAYMPALDGLRAVSILAVVFFHARVPLPPFGGYLGVDVFFVLSGFLITGLLLDEFRATGTIRVGAFYIRRARRLLPALGLLLAVYLAVMPWLLPEANHWAPVLFAALYVSDYARAFYGEMSLLSHTWSLSVEEHFYLLWPLAVLWMARRASLERLLWLLGAFYIAACLWRAGWLTVAPWDQVYHRFDTRMSGLILGAFIAVLVRYRPDFEPRPFMTRWTAVVAIVGLSLSTWGSTFGLTGGVALVEVATALVILRCRRPAPASLTYRALTWPPMVWLGGISYSVYLFHFPIVLLLADHYGWVVALTVGLPITLALAALSYYAIERPIVTGGGAAYESRRRSPPRPLPAEQR